jgi:hypothetical protein
LADKISVWTGLSDCYVECTKRMVWGEPVSCISLGCSSSVFLTPAVRLTGIAQKAAKRGYRKRSLQFLRLLNVEILQPWRAGELLISSHDRSSSVLLEDSSGVRSRNSCLNLSSLVSIIKSFFSSLSNTGFGRCNLIEILRSKPLPFPCVYHRSFAESRPGSLVRACSFFHCGAFILP